MLKMKSKITSFIMSLMTLLMLGILFFLAIIVYNGITKDDIVDEVQQFVSNITIFEENIKSPEILQNDLILSDYTDENVTPDTIIDKHFYNQLEEKSKQIYNEIDKNRENMKIGTYEINLGTDFSDILSKVNGEEILGELYQSAIEAYTYDNPDVFYIDFSKLYLNIETTTRGIKKTYRVFLNSGDKNNYLTEEFQTKEKIDLALEEIEKVKAYFVNNKTQNIYKNIKLVHDYLIESIDYDQSISKVNIYDIYGALVNKTSVCEGYAKAFKYLMDSVQIPCIIVIGKATNSEGNTENHAWNYVQINDVWYAVDCTWDDPILIGGGFLTKAHKYKYFLKGEDQFNKTHFPNGQFTENGKVFEFPILSQVDY